MVLIHTYVYESSDSVNYKRASTIPFTLEKWLKPKLQTVLVN